jgi:hypothetical protein
MDKSPILPAEHDPACRRSGPRDLDTESCERCRNLSARLDQWRTDQGFDSDLKATRAGRSAPEPGRADSGEDTA